jgi:hypothetical protein
VSNWKIWSGQTQAQKNWRNLNDTVLILSPGSEPVGKNEAKVASYLSFEHSNHKTLWFGEAQIPQLGVQNVVRRPLRTFNFFREGLGKDKGTFSCKGFPLPG